MSARIALLSAFIGNPGKQGLKMTDNCKRSLEGNGVDLYLFDDSDMDLLKRNYQPLVQVTTMKDRFEWFNKWRYRQHRYPTETDTYNRLVAKLPKMQFYRLLDREYDYYIWMDSKYTIQDGWLEWVSDLIGQHGNHDLIVCKHSERANVKEEFDYLKHYMLEKSDNLCSKYVLLDLYHQVAAYLKDPAYNDDRLYEAGFLLYSRNILVHKRFLDEWYAHNFYYSIQDQLSLPYLVQKHGIDVFPLEMNVGRLPGVKYGYFD